eukprot:s737_g15.t1
MKKVLQFLTSHTPELQSSVPDLFAKWEAAMKDFRSGGIGQETDGVIRDVLPAGLEDLEAASSPKDDL